MTTLVVMGSGCADESPTARIRGVVCDLNPELLISSLPPEAIPALTEPSMVASDSPEAEYLLESDRVLGVMMDGRARAYPHRILWHHEIVNDRVGDDWIAITFCPLTGSGLVFDPHLDERRLELGVSGLLFANNLVMYDRFSDEVYGPQLRVTGSCGNFRGKSLKQLPVQEMSWARWKGLHPDTKVVSSEQAFARNYRVYPYGSYNELTDNSLLQPMSVDRSRAIKERVLAIREVDGGRGYPFGELAELGDVVAVNEVVGGIPTVIFYEARDGQTALALDARVDGQTLTFEGAPDGWWTDRETGSTWAIDGSAIDGPLSGTRLETRSDAYTLFWFAWRHFEPKGRMFSTP